MQSLLTLKKKIFSSSFTMAERSVCEATGALVGFKERGAKPQGEQYARLCLRVFLGGPEYPLLGTEFQGHSDMLCSRGHYHWDKDELLQCQIYNSMEKNIILIYSNAKNREMSIVIFCISNSPHSETTWTYKFTLCIIYFELTSWLSLMRDTGQSVNTSAAASPRS